MDFSSASTSSFSTPGADNVGLFQHDFNQIAQSDCGGTKLCLTNLKHLRMARDLKDGRAEVSAILHHPEHGTDVYVLGCPWGLVLVSNNFLFSSLIS